MNEDTSESQLIYSCTGTASPVPHPTANFRRLFQDTNRGGREREVCVGGGEPSYFTAWCLFLFPGREATILDEGGARF